MSTRTVGINFHTIRFIKIIDAVSVSSVMHNTDIVNSPSKFPNKFRVEISVTNKANKSVLSFEATATAMRV